jgi:hypothetical protein
MWGSALTADHAWEQPERRFTDTSDDAPLEFAGALALPAPPQPASGTAVAAVATS